MIRSDEIILGEYSYSVQQLPAMKAMKVLNRISKALAPALGQLNLLQGADLMEADLSALGNAIGALVSNFSEDDTEQLIRDLFYNTTVKLEKGEVQLLTVINTHFCGRTLELSKLLGFAIKVNYSDFLAGALTLAPTEGAKASASKE